MKDNQEISFDDFIADIVIGLDAKFCTWRKVQNEMEKMGATSPNIEGAETPNIVNAIWSYIEGAGSPNIVGALSPCILGSTSPDYLNIIEQPNPLSSPFGRTSSTIVPMSYLHHHQTSWRIWTSLIMKQGGHPNRMIRFIADSSRRRADFLNSSSISSRGDHCFEPQLSPPCKNRKKANVYCIA